MKRMMKSTWHRAPVPAPADTPFDDDVPSPVPQDDPVPDHNPQRGGARGLFLLQSPLHTAQIPQ